MNEIMIKENINIEDMIYEIRGKQVMLDSDLAMLYCCKNGTKEINQAVTRNKEKFPERFSWVLDDNEENIFWSQFVTKKIEKRGGRYKNPRVFTEQGVAMLATILKSEIAIKVSIRIMDAFVAMHKYISNEYIEQKYMQNMLIKHDNDIKLLQESFEKLEEKQKVNEIYFHGKIYDAYSRIVDILKSAKKEVIIIDGYSDKTTLDIISNSKVKTILITKKKSNLKQIDINKYHKQYHNLKIIYNETFHDRYIIIDNKTFYHLGASINYAGSKTFGVNILADTSVKKALISDIKKIING